jgi:hypothetical protein
MALLVKHKMIFLQSRNKDTNYFAKSPCLNMFDRDVMPLVGVIMDHYKYKPICCDEMNLDHVILRWEKTASGDIGNTENAEMPDIVYTCRGTSRLKEKIDVISMLGGIEKSKIVQNGVRAIEQDIAKTRDYASKTVVVTGYSVGASVAVHAARKMLATNTNTNTSFYVFYPFVRKPETELPVSPRFHLFALKGDKVFDNMFTTRCSDSYCIKMPLTLKSKSQTQKHSLPCIWWSLNHGVVGCGNHGCVVKPSSIATDTVTAMEFVCLSTDGGTHSTRHHMMIDDWSQTWQALANIPNVGFKHLKSRKGIQSFNPKTDFDKEVQSVMDIITIMGEEFIRRNTAIVLPNIGTKRIVGIAVHGGSVDDISDEIQYLIPTRICERNVLSMKPLSVKCIKAMTRHALETIEQLQNKRLIHSDIKADNIVFCGPGDYRLIDWGELQKADSTDKPVASLATNNPMSVKAVSLPLVAKYALQSDFVIKFLQKKRGIRPQTSVASNYTEWLNYITVNTHKQTERIIRKEGLEGDGIIAFFRNKYDLFSLGVAILQVIDWDNVDNRVLHVAASLMLPDSDWNNAKNAKAGFNDLFPTPPSDPVIGGAYITKVSTTFTLAIMAMFSSLYCL